MLHVAIAQSQEVFTATAIDSVLAQCEAQLGGRTPQAGILFASGEFDYSRVTGAIMERFPGLALIGGTCWGTAGALTGFSEDSLSLLLLVSDTITFAAGLGRHCSRDIDAAVDQALSSARQALPGPETLCIAVPEVSRADANQIVHQLSCKVASQCGLFGAVAGPTWGEDNGDSSIGPYQFFGAEVITDALPVLLLSGPLEYSFSIENSWMPIGERQPVTRASGREVARIGNRTALEFYQHYLGGHTKPALEFPLAVFEGDSEHYYARVPSSYDVKTGVIRYSGPIPEGATVQLTEAVRSHVLAQSELSVQRAFDGLHGTRPALVLAASCGLRRLILGTQVQRESEILRSAAPTLPIFSVYAAGEIAPVEMGHRSIMHQATLVTVVIGVPTGERADELAGDKTPWTPPAVQTSRDLESDRAYLRRRLLRAEEYRIRLENAHDRDHAMLRKIGEEIARSRELISRQNQELQRLNAELEREKQTSEDLLLNILPRDVADELKRTGQVDPVHYESVTVLFTDFKDFSRITTRMTPHELLQELDYFFSEFDTISERYGLEKLKTIGDAYMCAGGIPAANSTHALDAVRAAWDMQSLMNRMAAERRDTDKPRWELRIGVHTGPLMAGVIGSKKFAYDIWGDTVNIAARMESSSTPGRINISQATYQRVCEHFACEPRGKVAVKNVGEIDMYFVLNPFLST